VSVRAEVGGVSLLVEDIGRGFDLESAGSGGGMGLGSIRERAAKLGGSLEVVSAPGNGTTVSVSLALGSG